MTLFYSVLGFLFAFVCVMMILLILIQKGRGGGLSSAFGGAGGNTAFGSKTGDVLTWVTSGVFVAFLLLAVALIWTGDAVNEAYNRVSTANIAGVDDDEDADGTPAIVAPTPNIADVDGDAPGDTSDVDALEGGAAEALNTGVGNDADTVPD